MGLLARRHGLALRAHVEQFNSHGSVPVALEAGARSVDHLACLPPDHVAPLAASKTAAVLLPGAAFLGNEHLEPARELADAGAICALASDFNPGTSPVNSLPLIVGLAVRRYRWSVLEALLACTLNAAWVLDRRDVGSLEVGLRADLLILDGPIDQIPYRLGHNPVAIGDRRRRSSSTSARITRGGSRGEPRRAARRSSIGSGFSPAVCAGSPGPTRTARPAAGSRSRPRIPGSRLSEIQPGTYGRCPDIPPPWWGVGSHLDSVRGGGRFDGPLGVAAGFELASRSAAAAGGDLVRR